MLGFPLSDGGETLSHEKCAPRGVGHPRRDAARDAARTTFA